MKFHFKKTALTVRVLPAAVHAINLMAEIHKSGGDLELALIAFGDQPGAEVRCAGEVIDQMTIQEFVEHNIPEKA